MAVCLTSIYRNERAQRPFDAAHRATGKRDDAGKSCVRFRQLDDLPLELAGHAIGPLSLGEFLAGCEVSRGAGKTA